jgi:hypothetical protein
LCEACWISETAERLPDADGVMLICHVPIPVRAATVGLEVCCNCGNATISGIYVKRDPETVKYPTLDDETIGYHSVRC